MLILTQNHEAIFTAKNIRIEHSFDSDLYYLKADVETNGVRACLTVAEYETKKEAKRVLTLIAENSRTNPGEVFDLRRA